MDRNQDAEHSRAACRDPGHNLQPDSRHSCGAATGNDAVPARARRKGRHARRATADAGRKFGQRSRERIRQQRIGRAKSQSSQFRQSGRGSATHRRLTRISHFRIATAGNRGRRLLSPARLLHQHPCLSRQGTLNHSSSQKGNHADFKQSHRSPALSGAAALHPESQRTPQPQVRSRRATPQLDGHHHRQ